VLAAQRAAASVSYRANQCSRRLTGLSNDAPQQLDKHTAQSCRDKPGVIERGQHHPDVSKPMATLGGEIKLNYDGMMESPAVIRAGGFDRFL
jgi:hypothetical protein